MGINIAVDVANLFGYAIALVLYGLYVFLFLNTISTLWEHRRRSPIVLNFAIALLLNTTTLIALYTVHNYNGFIKYRNNPGTDDYFSFMWTPIRPTIDFLFGLSSNAADLLLSWRLFIIWGQDRRVLILPAVTLTISFAVALTIFVLTFLQEDVLYSNHHEAFIAAGILSTVSTVVMNVTSTSMIVWKLFRVSHAIEARRVQNVYRCIMVALIESGSLYTVMLIIFTAYASAPGGAGGGTFNFVTYLAVMIVAISPMLIIQLLSSTTSSSFNTINPPSNPSSTSDSDASRRHRRKGLKTAVSTRILFRTFRSTSYEPDVYDDEGAMDTLPPKVVVTGDEDAPQAVDDKATEKVMDV